MSRSIGDRWVGIGDGNLSFVYYLKVSETRHCEPRNDVHRLVSVHKC